MAIAPTSSWSRRARAARPATDGLTLFAVEKGAGGLDVEAATLADSSKAARLNNSTMSRSMPTR